MSRHPDAPAVLAAFEAVYLDDRSTGSLRPPADYAAMFPGFEELIEKQYDRLEGQHADSRVHRAPSLGVGEFEARYENDVRGGSPRSLAEYVAMFPEHGASVAQRFAELEGAASQPPRTSDAGDPPAELGPYRIVRRIGRGGQGTVYLAEDTRLGRRVAVKVLAGADSRETLARFQREAGIVASLRHPNICTVHDAGEQDGFAFIVFGLVEGKTLAARLREARRGGTTAFAVDAVLRFGETIARTLHAAHESGVIHRDVKPGNVIVTDDGTPVVLDFGLARSDAGDATLTRTGDLFGTPAYMSPEQIEPPSPRDGPVDRRTDVYSLAATLFECFTGVRPFEAATRQDLYDAIVGEPAPDPVKLRPELPKELSLVFRTALAKSRDRRYQTALDFAEDLRRVRASEPIRAQPAGLLSRARMFARRRPASAACLALLAIGVAVNTVLIAHTHRLRAETASTRASVRSVRPQVAAVRDRAANELVARYRANLDQLEPALRARDGRWPPVAEVDEWLREARFVRARSEDPEELLARRITRMEARRRFLTESHVRTLHGIQPGEATLQMGNGFGDPVRAMGDVDGDGVTDLLVGARRDRRESREGGAAYLFSGKTGKLLRTLAPLGPHRHFGAAAVALGDVDGDRVPDVVVAAPGSRRQSARIRGSIYVLSGRTGRQLGSAHGERRGCRFGESLAVVGDVDGDGVADVAVAAPGSGQRHPGYVQTRSGRDLSVIWTRQAPDGHNRFGRGLTAVGDLDGDGTAELVLTTRPTAANRDQCQHLVVSAKDGRTLRALDLGAARGDPTVQVVSAGDFDGDGTEDLGYAFSAEEGPTVLHVQSGKDGRALWSVPCGLTTVRAARVTLAGDVNGDGRPDFLVGSRRATRGTAGLAVLSGADGTALLRFEAKARLGIVVAAAGDLDGDGRPEIAAGVPNRDFVVILRVPRPSH